MKKILIVILSLFMVFFCVGCGSYSQPDDNSQGDDNGGIVQQRPGNNQEQKDVFTVELKMGSSKYIPPFIPGKSVKARWTAIDGSSIHEAIFSDAGVAEADGLDGDYRVTLVDLPDTVTYDPQGYTADNNDKHTVIEILQIIKTTHSTGSSLQNSGITTIDVNVNDIAGSTYRSIIDSPWNGVKGGGYEGQENEVYNGMVFYLISPTMPGWYSIESWVDVSANEVNPLLEYYSGTIQARYYNESIDSGGSVSTYTKNFRYEIKLGGNYVGNVWALGIHAESKKGEYPITIDFTIKYEGEYDEPEPKYTEMEANGPYGNPNETPSGKFIYNYKETNKTLVGSRFKLNPEDDFYHLYDESTYAQNNGYGPILYAKISKASEVLVTSNGFLQKPDAETGLGGVNLKIQFHDPFNYNVIIYKNYEIFIEKYAVYCNSDGVHPVNEELKQFLQDWSMAESNLYFHDGDGWAETTVGLKSSYEDQWLFGCGYYQ